MSDERQSKADSSTGSHRSSHLLGGTEFGDVGRVTKHDVRLSAFGACEEANVAVGAALTFGDYDVDVVSTLTSVQNDIFDAMADLSAPLDQAHDPDPVRITDHHIAWVDRAGEHYSSQLSPVDEYVLPGGTVPAVMLYRARVSVRRAERSTLKAMSEHPESMNPLVPQYLNSVSSLLFVLARVHNDELGDTMWGPLASITPPPES